MRQVGCDKRMVCCPHVSSVPSACGNASGLWPLVAILLSLPVYALVLLYCSSFTACFLCLFVLHSGVTIAIVTTYMSVDPRSCVRGTERGLQWLYRTQVRYVTRFCSHAFAHG